MPVVVLQHATKELRNRLAQALYHDFPDLRKELCLNWIWNSQVSTPYAHVDSSSDIPPSQLELLRQCVNQHVIVIPRPIADPAAPKVNVYGKYAGLANNVRTMMNHVVPVFFVQADCRLLNSHLAPYAEYHPTKMFEADAWITRDALKALCDLEIWYSDGMQFFPKQS